VIFSWRSGWFDAGQKKLDAERLVLQVDIKDLEKKKSEYSATIRNLARTNDIIRTTAVALSNRVVGLTKEREELENLKNAFKQKAEKLAGADTNLQALVNDFASTRIQCELFRSIAVQFWSDAVKGELARTVTNAFEPTKAQSILRDVQNHLPKIDEAHGDILNEIGCDPSVLQEWAKNRTFAIERLEREKAASYPSLDLWTLIGTSQYARPSAPTGLRIVSDAN
jgi:hypothetical protein